MLVRPISFFVSRPFPSWLFRDKSKRAPGGAPVHAAFLASTQYFNPCSIRLLLLPYQFPDHYRKGSHSAIAGSRLHKKVTPRRLPPSGVWWPAIAFQNPLNRLRHALPQFRRRQNLSRFPECSHPGAEFVPARHHVAIYY